MIFVDIMFFGTQRRGVDFSGGEGNIVTQFLKLFYFSKFGRVLYEISSSKKKVQIFCVRFNATYISWNSQVSATLMFCNKNSRNSNF